MLRVLVFVHGRWVTSCVLALAMAHCFCHLRDYFRDMVAEGPRDTLLALRLQWAQVDLPTVSPYLIKPSTQSAEYLRVVSQALKAAM